jgi:diaminopimelate decarboxylase
MDYFQRRHGVLHAEDVPLTDIADAHGTPTYVYSRATITRHVRVLQQGVGELDHLLCYAVKANGNLAVLDLINRLGCGFDAVSGGELARVMAIGADPKTTLVSGIGKRDDEIAQALSAGVLYLCVESAEELDATAQIARHMGVRARVSVRVNPDVDPRTHPYIATGLKQNKFGVPMADAMELYERGRTETSLQMVGVTCHIGSQVTALEPFLDAAQRMAELAGQLRAAGTPLQHLGMGGGLGVPYFGGDEPPSPERYGQELAAILKPLGLRVVLEPGRVIVGNAGVLLTRVVRQKQGADRRFVIVDAGMNDLLRPALYGAQHDLEPVVAGQEHARQPVDVVGPVCESSDTFSKSHDLPALRTGDLLALRTVGAYGAVMSSTYNGRPLAAEVLCDGDQALLVRERQAVSDLWRGERRLPSGDARGKTN